jgi:hypothetical protein
MSTLAVDAVEETIADGTTYVSSAQAYDSKCFLASDFDADDRVRFECTSTGKIEVVTSEGARIGIVGPESSAMAVLRDSGEWDFYMLPASPAALVADGSDAATTQTLANALKAILVNAGLMKAE